MKKRIPMAILAIIILTALDQLVKHLISTNFQVGQTRKIIDGVFQLNYVQNRGAAWGSFSGKIVFLLAITFVILLAPFAPHIGEELWQQLGGSDTVFHAQWPVCDEEAMKDDEISVAVQVNGKTKAVITLSAGTAREEAIEAGRALVTDKITGTIVKEIYVPGRIINIVCK